MTELAVAVKSLVSILFTNTEIKAFPHKLYKILKVIHGFETSQNCMLVYSDSTDQHPSGRV